MKGLDPPLTLTEHTAWAENATRPFTQAAIGARSTHNRARCARLSALWAPERYGRMYRPIKPVAAPQKGGSNDTTNSTGVEGSDEGSDPSSLCYRLPPHPQRKRRYRR